MNRDPFNPASGQLVVGRPTFPYQVVEELPVIRAESAGHRVADYSHARGVWMSGTSLVCGLTGAPLRNRVPRICFAGRLRVPFFSNVDIPVAYSLLAWVQDFLVEPHPMMKRSPSSVGEPICPFAKPVLSENALYMTFHHEVNGKSAELIESIVLSYRDPFKKATPFQQKERLKKALLIVFPEIPAEETEVLDLVHASVKSQFVRDGLMAAQCHARCDGRSVHNAALKVYASPYPLFVLRHMAMHDILFLEENESWFAAYDLRYGARFKEPEKLEDFERPLIEIYRRAKARFLR